MIRQPAFFWNIAQTDLLAQLDTRQEGLSSEEARRRLISYGANLLTPQKRSDTFALLLAQFKNPIILTLIFAAGLSFFLQDHVDAAIITPYHSGRAAFWDSGKNGAQLTLLKSSWP